MTRRAKHPKTLIHEEIIMDKQKKPRKFLTQEMEDVQAAATADDPDDDEPDVVATVVLRKVGDEASIVAGPFYDYVDVDLAVETLVIDEAVKALLNGWDPTKVITPADTNFASYFYVDFLTDGEADIAAVDPGYVDDLRGSVWFAEES